MFEKYIMIKENKIVCGQTASGIWYCKELPVDSVGELRGLIGEVNNILNEYNEKKDATVTERVRRNICKQE